MNEVDGGSETDAVLTFVPGERVNDRGDRSRPIRLVDRVEDGAAGAGSAPSGIVTLTATTSMSVQPAAWSTSATAVGSDWAKMPGPLSPRFGSEPHCSSVAPGTVSQSLATSACQVAMHNRPLGCSAVAVLANAAIGADESTPVAIAGTTASAAVMVVIPHRQPMSRTASVELSRRGLVR